MADSKITALTAISTVDPTADPLVIVDVSDTSMAASGTTKKSTINQLLGAGGTATLASATITGDLTVDTNTLKVDSANNRVGIGTASPTVPLYVTGNNATATAIMQDETNGAKLRLLANSINFDLSNGGGGGGISVSGNNPIIFQTNGSEQMRLNSTGLGVGASPAERLTIGSSTAANYIKLTNTGATNGFLIGCYNTSVDIRNKEAGAMNFFTSDTQRMQIDASGQVGIGVTPSATLDVYTSSGDCTAQFKSNAAGSNVISTLDYVSSYGITRIKKSGTTVWETGVIGSTSATPSYSIFNASSIGVYLTSGGTSWTGISDERLKDIIEPISNAVQKVGSLRSVIGKFKNDETNTRRSFLIAQDVQAVLPEAVDASNPDRLGVAYTEVIPLLVAAIKELTARVQTLETR